MVTAMITESLAQLQILRFAPDWVERLTEPALMNEVLWKIVEAKEPKRPGPTVRVARPKVVHSDAEILLMQRRWSATYYAKKKEQVLATKRAKYAMAKGAGA